MVNQSTTRAMPVPYSQRRSNAAAILQLAWDVPAFTASDGMRETGLTRSTVIALCDDLVESGWLAELADARAAGEYRKGRPARRYALRADAGVVIGVDAGPHRITATVADLFGAELGHAVEHVSRDKAESADRMALTDGVVDAALTGAGIEASRVLCITLGVPAPTDLNGTSPAAENAFWRVMNPGFAQHFVARGWAAVVENDANLAAVAEGRLGAGAGVPSYIALLSGERFGAGYVVNGQLIRGTRGGAGEMRLLNLVENVGSADGIGALLRDWVRTAKRSGNIPAGSVLHKCPLTNLDAPEVFQAADGGDVYAVQLIDWMAERLARICAILAGLLDVDRIVIAGAVAEAIDLLLERTRARLAGLTHPPAPDVVASKLGSDVVSAGAVTKALAYTRDNALDLVLEDAAG